MGKRPTRVSPDGPPLVLAARARRLLAAAAQGARLDKRLWTGMAALTGAKGNSTSLVGTPDRRLLWILSRSPHLDDATYQRLVDRGRTLGYSVWDLIRAKRPPSN